MLILIICLSVLGLMVSGYLTYAGIDALVKNKNEPKRVTPRAKSSLYRVRAYPFAYKEEDGQKPEGLFSASILYKDEQRQKEAQEGLEERR